MVAQRDAFIFAAENAAALKFRNHEVDEIIEAFAQRYRLAELMWPGGGAPFLNVNTPAELSVAAARFSGGAPASARLRSRR